MKNMKKKFVVSYEIDYVHRVSVGISAHDQAEAQLLVEQAFNEALIWDNSETMPLLSDDYYESADGRINWECEQVEHYPDQDDLVRQLKKQQAVFLVCQGLLEAYQRGEASGTSIDWEDLDQFIPLALEFLNKKALAIEILTNQFYEKTAKP